MVTFEITTSYLSTSMFNVWNYDFIFIDLYGYVWNYDFIFIDLYV